MKRCGDKAGEGTFTFGKMPEETEGSLMMLLMKVSMMIMTLWWGYSWADEILLDSLLESSNSRRDFDENY